MPRAMVAGNPQKRETPQKLCACGEAPSSGVQKPVQVCMTARTRSPLETRRTGATTVQGAGKEIRTGVTR